MSVSYAERAAQLRLVGICAILSDVSQQTGEMLRDTSYV